MEKVILFQGDSITDAGRDREAEAGSAPALGSGYPGLTAAFLGLSRVSAYSFLNRGCAGDGIPDLYARMRRDILNLRPWCMSILIGVDDALAEVSRSEGTPPDKFRKILDLIVEESLDQNPDMKILLLEPFILPGTGTREQYTRLRRELGTRALGIRAVAEKYSLPFLPLQELFDRAEYEAPAPYWLHDGIHPTPSGHALIAKAWLEAFEKL